MSIWLITGCSSGLGKGIAQAVLKRGEKAAITARDPEAVEALAREYPSQALPLKLDLNDRESMRLAVEKTCEHFGTIDVLVNNAGHGYRAAVEESEPEKVEELFDTNFFAPAELMKMVLPVMRKQRRGTIVNVTSIGAVRGALGNGYYSAAKGALELLTEALAKETEHLGIRTMLVEPGAFRTNFYGEGLLGTEKKIGKKIWSMTTARPEIPKKAAKLLWKQSLERRCLSVCFWEGMRPKQQKPRWKTG